MYIFVVSKYSSLEQAPVTTMAHVPILSILLVVNLIISLVAAREVIPGAYGIL